MPSGRHLDRAELPIRHAVGDLDVARQPDAELADVAAGPAALLLRPQVVVARHLEGQVQGAPVVSGVVRSPGGCVVREGVGSDQVTASDLGRVHADFGGEHVHGPLDGGGRLRPPGSPVGHGRCRIGHDRDARALRLGDCVHAARHGAGHEGEDGAKVGVGAAVLQHLNPVRPNDAVTVAAEPDPLHLGTAMPEPEHALRPGLGPADRPVEVQGAPTHHELLGIDRALRAEPATHVGSHHVDAVRRKGQCRGQHLAYTVRGLGRRVELQPAVGIHTRGRRAHLQRTGRHPLVGNRPVHHDLAALEECRVAPEVQCERGVRPRLGKEQDLVLQGFGRVDDRRERFVLDDDLLCGIRRGLAGLGDDGDDRLADVANGPRCQDAPGHGHGRHVHDRRQIAQAEVGLGVDGEHPGHGDGSGGVDGLNRGMGHARPDEGQVDRPR